MRQSTAQRKAKMPDCDVRGCRKAQLATGLCGLHYNRRRRGIEVDKRGGGAKKLPAVSVSERDGFRGAGFVECHMCGVPVRDHTLREMCNG